ncbi:MAG TPA: hypothetical protein PKE26_04865 [Kiritimatiellia bacterium]|nr:hypothetical protein [Kiritimatiellia bacterium]
MIVLLVAVCALVPHSITHFRDYFDASLREGNVGHYDYHPASLLWSGTNLILAAALLLSLLGNVTATRIAMIVVLYTPLYVLFGNYVVNPRGLHTPALNVLVIIVVVIACELLLAKQLRNVKGFHALCGQASPP